MPSISTAPHKTGNTVLDTVLAMIGQGFTRVVSFDIFDTLAWRSYRRPTDAFYDLYAFHGERGLTIPGSARTFAEARILAEASARANRRDTGLGTEVNLHDVYREVARLLAVPDMDEAAFAASEVAFESTILHPDTVLLDFVKYLHDETDVQLALTSDTYFTPKEVTQLLVACGYPEDLWSHVFCSSAIGVGKGSGLFDRVISTFGFTPDRIVHLGDNVQADVHGAGASGVKTLHWTVDHGQLDEINSFETRTEAPKSHGIPVAANYLRRDPLRLVEDGAGGLVAMDRGLTAMRSRIGMGGRGNPKGKGAGTRTPQSTWGEMFLGPVMDGFAKWVAQRAVQEGLPVLYFFQREGDFLCELVSNAINAIGAEVRCQIVPVSRFALLSAAHQDFDESYLRAVGSSRRPPNARTILRKLGFSTTPAGLEELVEKPSLTPDELQRLFTALLTRPDLVARGQSELRERRTRTLRFIKDTFDLDAPAFGVVDLGWAGSIQASLRAGLTDSGYTGVVFGFYLATTYNAAKNTAWNNRMEGLIGNLGVPRDVEPLLRNPEIIEQSCLERVGSVVGYSEEGLPLREETAIPPAQWREIAEIQRGALRYQRASLSHAVNHSGCSLLNGSAVDADLITDIVTRITAAPTAEELEMFKDWRHDDNYGTSATERILPTFVQPTGSKARQTLTSKLTLRDLFWQSGAQAIEGVPSAADGTDTVQLEMHGYAVADSGSSVVLSEALALQDQDGKLAAYASVGGGGIAKVRLAIVVNRAIVRMVRIVVETETGGETIAAESHSWSGIVKDPTTRLLSPELAQVRTGVLRITVPLPPGPNGQSPDLVRVSLDAEVQPYRAVQGEVTDFVTRLSARRLRDVGSLAGQKLLDRFNK